MTGASAPASTFWAAGPATRTIRKFCRRSSDRISTAGSTSSELTMWCSRPTRRSARSRRRSRRSSGSRSRTATAARSSSRTPSGCSRGNCRNARGEHMRLGSSIAAALLLATSGLILLSPAAGAETLRVGKAVPEAFSFVPLDIGMRKGLFAKQGLEIESIAFTGDARMQQAMASDSLDIALGSGPAMAFIVKGAPIKAVAAMAGPPLLLAIVVRPEGPKTGAELKGKKISVSTAGSLTYWLVSETSRRQGWGPKGIEIAPMGALPGQIAAMKRGDIDGAIMDIGNAFELEKRGEGRILVRF